MNDLLYLSQMEKVPFPVRTTRRRRGKKVKKLGVQSRPEPASRHFHSAWILSARCTLNNPSLLSAPVISAPIREETSFVNHFTMMNPSLYHRFY